MASPRGSFPTRRSIPRGAVSRTVSSTSNMAIGFVDSTTLDPPCIFPKGRRRDCPLPEVSPFDICPTCICILVRRSRGRRRSPERRLLALVCQLGSIDVPPRRAQSSSCWIGYDSIDPMDTDMPAKDDQLCNDPTNIRNLEKRRRISCK